jgi:hypothetical protein
LRVHSVNLAQPGMRKLRIADRADELCADLEKLSMFSTHVTKINGEMVVPNQG